MLRQREKLLVSSWRVLEFHYSHIVILLAIVLAQRLDCASLVVSSHRYVVFEFSLGCSIRWGCFWCTNRSPSRTTETVWVP